MKNRQVQNPDLDDSYQVVGVQGIQNSFTIDSSFRHSHDTSYEDSQDWESRVLSKKLGKAVN